MYCDRCGTSLASSALFCSTCGKQVIRGSFPPAPVSAPPAAQGRVRRHIHRLATLWLISGVLRLTAVGWFLLFGPMFIPFMRNWGGVMVWPFGRFWGADYFLSRGVFSLGVFLACFGVLHLVLAWGLFERHPWARALGLVLGILALIRFPFGTALGVFTLWVLAPEESSREYERLTHPVSQWNSAPTS